MKIGCGLLDDGFNIFESMQFKVNLIKYFEDDESYVCFYLKVVDIQELFYIGLLVYVNISNNKIFDVRFYFGMDGCLVFNFFIFN